MCGPSTCTSTGETLQSWHQCRVNSTFLECYAEASTSGSRPRSRSVPPPAKATPSSSLTSTLQQAYVQSLAERAEQISKLSNVAKAMDEIQRPSSAPSKLVCGITSDAKELASSGRSCAFQYVLEDTHVPKQAAKENIGCNRFDYSEVDEHDGGTTVMLCNIPCRVKLEEITLAVRSLGFDGTYNLLHSPGPKRKHRHLTSTTNVGYAFINFVTPEYAQQFMKVFTGFCFESRLSYKVGTAKLARVQGFRNNYMLMRSSLARCALPMGVPAEFTEVQKQ